MGTGGSGVTPPHYVPKLVWVLDSSPFTPSTPTVDVVEPAKRVGFFGGVEAFPTQIPDLPRFSKGPQEFCSGGKLRETPRTPLIFKPPPYHTTMGGDQYVGWGKQKGFVGATFSVAPHYRHLPPSF